MAKIILGMGLLMAIAATVMLSLGAIPLTTHAALGHANTWNATNIKATITNKGCRQTQYYLCPALKQARMLCVLPNGQAGQLLFGLQGKTVIVTGYAKSLSGWQYTNAQDGCMMVAASQFPTMLLP